MKVRWILPVLSWLLESGLLQISTVGEAPSELSTTVVSVKTPNFPFSRGRLYGLKSLRVSIGIHANVVDHHLCRERRSDLIRVCNPYEV